MPSSPPSTRKRARSESPSGDKPRLPPSLRKTGPGPSDLGTGPAKKDDGAAGTPSTIPEEKEERHVRIRRLLADKEKARAAKLKAQENETAVVPPQPAPSVPSGAAFAGVVRFHRGEADALKHAAKELDYSVDENNDFQATIFADASRGQNHRYSVFETGAYAIAYRRPGEADPLKNPFLVRSWRVKRMHHIDHGEMLAIAEAMDAGLGLAGSGELEGTLRIFSDSKECLCLLECGTIEEIRRRNPYIDESMEDAIRAIIWMSHRLRSLLGPAAGRLELNWMPGHGHRIYPHLVMDEVSRDTRRGWKTGKASLLNEGRNLAWRWKWDDTKFQDSLTSHGVVLGMSMIHSVTSLVAMMLTLATVVVDADGHLGMKLVAAQGTLETSSW
ncbi:hypothetical protein QBC39DRAFT_436278 [Podospora conica]|nr:hypothetical protein QBC39DRAFT_436278 [Schizothecium conicum]